MGFFDLITKGIEVVKGLVVNPPPFLKTIEKYAGIVANGVPFLGPALDIAAPALDAIFSTVPDPIKSKPSSTTDPEPYPIVLKQKKEDMDAILGSFKAYVTESKDALDKRLTEVSTEIQKAVQEIKDHIEHNEFIKLQGEVELYVHYFTLQRTALEDLDATSGPDSFEEIFNNLKLKDNRDELGKVVNQIRTRIAQPKMVPTQALLDLYLLSVHWLLIFDKAVIVVRGLQIRSYWAWSSYSSYLKAIGRLHEDIKVIRDDAIWARDTLTEFIDQLLNERDEHISMKTIEVPAVPNPGGGIVVKKLIVDDDWKPLGVGWIGRKSLQAAINTTEDPDSISFEVSLVGNDDADAVTKKHFKTNILLFKQIARANLEAHLAPCRAVINGLDDSVSRWDTRLPLKATTVVKGQNHAEVSATAVPRNLASGQAQPRLAGKQIAYAVTYVNSYGESPVSKWSNLRIVGPNEASLEIVLAEVNFKNDPTAVYERIKTGGTLAPRDRGIRRRIYIQYKEHAGDEKLKTEFVGEVAESDTIFIHKLVEDPVV